MEQQELSFTPGGTETWHCHFERKFDISYKIKHTSYMIESQAPQYLEKGIKTDFYTKKFHRELIAALSITIETWK